MTKAYIILAHKNAEQIKKLIRSLDDGASQFFLHIDLKSKLKFKDIALGDNTNLHQIKSLNSNWGAFGLVQATINALIAVKNSPIVFERIILLSGQDYPIKSNKFINDFYSITKYSIFLDHFSIPDYKKWPANGGTYRVDKYFLGLSLISKISAKAVNFLAFFIKNFHRKLKKEMRHYHGSQWWTIDNYALNYILQFINDHVEYITFHKYTFAPDELFFQTILLNSDDPEIINKIFNDNKMFMKWGNEFVAHPDVLTKSDFNLIRSSSCLYARKFDLMNDADILIQIDQLRLTDNFYS